ncbi:hypothetical protein [Micromonospora sp. SH-82]|uniref:hypothetical protein n=1 Tax=Micromonospora sp. SH-82 TaxID=3132938 RepID=UPI003EBB7D3A
MTIRRFSTAVFAAALLTPALAACTGTDTAEPGASATPTASGSAAPDPSGGPTGATDADAKQALLASTNEIKNGNFTFTMSGGGSTAEGQVHEPSQSAQMKVTLGEAGSDLMVVLDIVHVKPESWVKAEVGGRNAPRLSEIRDVDLSKYQRLDQTKIQNDRNLGFDFDKLDPAGSEVITQSMTEVRREGDGSYAGTIDLTKAAEAGSLDDGLVAQIGPEVRTVPFTARLDPQGRLSELAIQIADTGEGRAEEVKVTYSDYGNATAAQKPPADQVQEAPEALYSLFR